MTLALYVQIRLNQAAAKGHCVIINTMYLLYHILLEVRVSGSGIREELIQKSFRLIFKQLQKWYGNSKEYVSIFKDFKDFLLNDLKLLLKKLNLCEKMC